MACKFAGVSGNEVQIYDGVCEEGNGVILSGGVVIIHPITHVDWDPRPHSNRDRAPRLPSTSRPAQCSNSGGTADHNLPSHYTRKKGSLISTGYAARTFKTCYFCSSVCTRNTEWTRKQEDLEREKQKANLWSSSGKLASVPGLRLALTLIAESHGDY